MKSFNQKDWEIKIKKPFWYQEIPELLNTIDALRSNNFPRSLAFKNKIYDFFENSLKEGSVTLGANGNKWNKERKPIDTIVIHHTKSSMSLSKERLSAIELIRLYAPAYAKREKKEPIYSDHNRNGKQVFYPYHWLIRRNGEAERLLLDHEIGWHSGDWDTNCRSVAICIDNNHENSMPEEIVLRSIAQVIRNHYSFVVKERVVGHREINLKTSCPSNTFLNNPDGSGWKEKLLDMI